MGCLNQITRAELDGEMESGMKFSAFEIYQAAEYDANVFIVGDGVESITVYGQDFQSPLFNIEKFVDMVLKGKKHLLMSVVHLERRN
jgi:hypothetical protein